jgi:integrase
MVLTPLESIGGETARAAVPSVWVARRPRKSGGVSYRVMFRAGGRESAPRYAGAFPTMREARIRRDYVAGELAALRMPDTRLGGAEMTAETLRDACERWRASRVDVTQSTRVLHRVALGRVLPVLGSRPVASITAADVAEVVSTLSAAGKKRETIRKSVKYLAAVLDECGVDPNPARAKSIRLPHEEHEELVPPTAAHVEAVYRLLASAYRLPLLWLDWSGARVSSVDTLTVGDYDEPARRVRLRASRTKTRAALWVELPDVLADALEAALPPREDRNPAAPLFPGASADRLRTAIARACRAAGVPVFSPHDLRHRRISLLHRQGRSWAEIGRFVGQRKLSITADTYTHVLLDSAEVDYSALACPTPES